MSWWPINFLAQYKYNKQKLLLFVAQHGTRASALMAMPTQNQAGCWL
jgi:hypothetical protein